MNNYPTQTEPEPDQYDVMEGMAERDLISAVDAQFDLGLPLESILALVVSRHAERKADMARKAVVWLGSPPPF